MLLLQSIFMKILAFLLVCCWLGHVTCQSDYELEDGQREGPPEKQEIPVGDIAQGDWDFEGLLYN
ncbi:uncharacterized protein [Drosophila kikkawai]|uniref:Uncharacterized protein n=1 Tax=Drosophila kikkawai TaxID=30033 RepID=A0A6P4IVZ9_DROKI|nr:uncharacterized protein LOC108082398 [Drosophila kikkawai]